MERKLCVQNWITNKVIFIDSAILRGYFEWGSTPSVIVENNLILMWRRLFIAFGHQNMLH